MISKFRLLDRYSNTPAPQFNDFSNQPVGSGAFGQVFRSIHKTTKKVYAIKQIPKRNPKTHEFKQDYELERINHQLQIMYQLDCEYIIKTYDHFEDPENIYLIMEYVDGEELYKGIIKKKKKLENVDIAKIIYQLCLALKYLHGKNIIHRDIKPENIMVMRNKDIKLIDFGTSNFVGPQETRITKTGSEPYFAPQIVREDRHGSAVDVWCVGILLYEMFVLKTPFEQYKKTQINILINKVSYPMHMDHEMKDLIEKILVKQASKRLTLDQIIKHPWIIKTLFPKPPSSKSLIVPRSKSFQKHCFIKKSSSKQHFSHRSQKSIPKGSKVPKTATDLLKQKISKLSKQISQASILQKKIQLKKKQLLCKKISQRQQKLLKSNRQSIKYQSIIKINNKKIIQIKTQLQQFQTFRQQSNILQTAINDKKQQLSIQNQNRIQLRNHLFNLESKLVSDIIMQRINRNSRNNTKITQRSSNSKSKVHLSKTTSTLFTQEKIHNTSLDKYKYSKSQKITTQSSYRQQKIAEIQAYIQSLK